MGVKPTKAFTPDLTLATPPSKGHLSLKDYLTFTIHSPTSPEWASAPNAPIIFKVQGLRIIIHYVGRAYLAAQDRFMYIFSITVEAPKWELKEIDFPGGKVWITADGKNQFDYSNPIINCYTEDASASCGSIALAALRALQTSDTIDSDVLAEGFLGHQSLGLTDRNGNPDLGEYAYASDVVRAHKDVHLLESIVPEEFFKVRYTEKPEELSEEEQINKYTHLLECMKNGDQGFLQTGAYFLMYKRDFDGYLFFDSHGSGFIHDDEARKGIDGSYGAYLAKLDNINSAAAFLTKHRNLNQQEGSHTQLTLHPIEFITS